MVLPRESGIDPVKPFPASDSLLKEVKFTSSCGNLPMNPLSTRTRDWRLVSKLPAKFSQPVEGKMVDWLAEKHSKEERLLKCFSLKRN
ncbi:hypothetical protein HPP92_009992 [Vanilla planifolia]|uniref:Uncharacterized protein n=1 Tax=Vanilla planifolia TaxID=51239 RepID=A0A835R8P6_VANPL|nr:hypothetical protein HPP92_009992 [Vanilla planifolia]